MNKKAIVTLFIMSMLICFSLVNTSRSEFYRYVTEDGKIFYVDDLTKIPEEYRDDLKVYKEKYDHLPENERLMMIEKERVLNENRLLDEKKRREQIEREQYLRSLQTKVTIVGNQILVPVTLGQGLRQVRTLLLLDTGASHIVLYKNFANYLAIEPYQKSRALVAGGKMINSERAKLESFRVGPIKMENIDVTIISHEGPPVQFSGLLGMNFLRNIEYSIDFKNKLIKWKPES
ncbi:MAG: clan AA aspartic protease [Deltaproteobacteria bacterium]|nr:MAG: clan AA aspartic protease [Deltaproteobacteria bacterium]